VPNFITLLGGVVDRVATPGACAATSDAGDREKAMEAGCNEYDTKPVEILRLLGKKHSACRTSKVGSAPEPTTDIRVLAADRWSAGLFDTQ
jgi:CheY-like chemotaxis protein